MACTMPGGSRLHTGLSCPGCFLRYCFHCFSIWNHLIYLYVQCPCRGRQIHNVLSSRRSHRAGVPMVKSVHCKLHTRVSTQFFRDPCASTWILTICSGDPRVHFHFPRQTRLSISGAPHPGGRCITHLLAVILGWLPPRFFLPYLPSTESGLSRRHVRREDLSLLGDVLGRGGGEPGRIPA
jgi:hypothetical protein